MHQNSKKLNSITAIYLFFSKQKNYISVNTSRESKNKISTNWEWATVIDNSSSFLHIYFFYFFDKFRKFLLLESWNGKSGARSPTFRNDDGRAENHVVHDPHAASRSREDTKNRTTVGGIYSLALEYSQIELKEQGKSSEETESRAMHTFPSAWQRSAPTTSSLR